MRKRFEILTYKIIFLSINILVLFVLSCKKDTSNSSYIAKAVVQGYLVANQPISIYLKKEILIGSTDTITQTIDGLTVKITPSVGSTMTLIFKGKGIYVSDSTYKVVAGETYKLDFIYNGTEITSTTVVPFKPAGVSISDTLLSIPPNTRDFSSEGSLNLTWSNPGNDFFLVVVQSLDTLTLIDSSFYRRRFFRNQPIQSNTEQINAREFSYYGKHDVILYKLNADYAALYNGMQNNSQNLTKPVSNINNGLGIFSGMNTDTLTITITQ